MENNYYNNYLICYKRNVNTLEKHIKKKKKKCHSTDLLPMKIIVEGYRLPIEREKKKKNNFRILFLLTEKNLQRICIYKFFFFFFFLSKVNDSMIEMMMNSRSVLWVTMIIQKSVKI